MSRFTLLPNTRRFHATLLVLVGITGVPLSAGTVVIQASSSEPFAPQSSSQPENTFCAQSDIGPVSCSILADFFNLTSHASAHAEGHAAADFGSISGSFLGAQDRSNIAGSDESTFGDFVTVVGGTGQGTLITHYHLISSGEEAGEPGVALAPFYRFIQGNIAVEHTPALPPTLEGLVSTLPEDLDVTSTITFGVPLTLGAGARITVPFFGGPSGPGGGFSAISSNAQITGFTVLDSAGHVVDDATIQRSFSTVQPDPFAPEPGTVAMIVTGGAAVILLRRAMAVR